MIVENVRLDIIPVTHAVDQISLWQTTEVIARGGSFVWVEDDILLGWVDFCGTMLDHLYVRRNHTGPGIGKKVVRLCEGELSREIIVGDFSSQRRREAVLRA